MKKLIVLAIAAFAAASAQAANNCPAVNAKYIDENSDLNTILVSAGYEFQSVAAEGKLLPPTQACVDGDMIKYQAPVCVPSTRDHCANIKYVPAVTPIKGETQALVCTKWEHRRDGNECVKHEWQTQSFEYATSYSLNVFAAESAERHGDFWGKKLCFTKEVTVPACGK